MNEIQKVFCEITGNETTLEDTQILVRIDGVIALKNFNYPNVDIENRLIRTANNAPIEFYSEIAVPDAMKRSFGRLFSIVNDKSDLEQSTGIMSKEGRNTFFEIKTRSFLDPINNGYSMIQFSENDFFVIVDSIASSRMKTCENWGVSFRSIGRKYRYKKFLDEKIKEVTFGGIPFLSLGYDIGVNDCHSKNPNGTGYEYKTEGSFKPIDLCCNESAVAFSQKNDVLLYYNDFLRFGKLRLLSPGTATINKNLQNPYLYTSLNF